MASWLRVKGLVDDDFTDQTLIDDYSGTGCVDSDKALVDEDSIKDVFGEWRLLLNVRADGYSELDFTFFVARRLIERHGHFILVTGDFTMHANVVFGIKLDNDARTPYDFSLYLMDPLDGGVQLRHYMYIDFPVRVALGMAQSTGRAACRTASP